MKKGETILERVVFTTVCILKMVTPPIYSLDRLEKYCKSQIEKNPKANSPRAFLAQLYKDYKLYEKAKQTYEELKYFNYLSGRDYLNLGEVYFYLNDYQKVINTLTPIIQKYPRNQNLKLWLGISYLKENTCEKATTFLESAIKLGCKWYGVFWHLGYCYHMIGKLSEAKEAYYKALSIKADSKELRQNIALLHINIGQSLLETDIGQAEGELKKALEINPDDLTAQRLMDNVQQIKILRSKIAEAEKLIKMQK